MRTYRDFAARNGVTLPESGACPFCGADLERSVHECVEIFEIGFGDLDGPERYRTLFFMVDAHALQHPELHGRWSDHFHLARLVAVLDHGVEWRYEDSRTLSAAVDEHAARSPDERLAAPPPGNRGDLTVASVRAASDEPEERATAIATWARSVHGAWSHEHRRVEPIVERFLTTRR